MWDKRTHIDLTNHNSKLEGVMVARTGEVFVLSVKVNERLDEYDDDSVELVEGTVLMERKEVQKLVDALNKQLGVH